MKILRELPATTQSGASINFSENVVKNCLEVYQRDVMSGIYHYCGPWVEGWEYGDNCVALPLKSVLLRWDILPRYDTKFCSLFGMGGKSFATMKGYHKDAWLSALREATEQLVPALPLDCISLDVDKCCGKDMDFVPDNVTRFHLDKELALPCSDTLTGCHVILDEKSQWPMIEGEEIHIVPLCTAHSGMSPNLATIGAGYYMRLARFTPTLVIPFRFCGAAIECYMRNQETSSKI